MIALWKRAALLLHVASATIYYSETFDSPTIPSNWVISSVKSDYGKWAISSGKFYADKAGSQGLKTSEDAKFYSISVPLTATVSSATKSLIVQFSVKHEQSIDCGGGYVKLFPPSFDPTKFDGESVYGVMFGPDICGSNAKTHAILAFNGKNVEIKDTLRAENDQLTHLYTFILNPDKTYTVKINNKEISSGEILKSWDLLPPKTIKDPDVKQPSDWVDQEFIDDPTDVKPADYDDRPASIPDPSAEKPEDWDDEDDGEFEPPLIPNPDYTGPYQPPRIPNPAWIGEWVHPEIANPEFPEESVAKSVASYEIGFLGFDLWQVKSGTIFDDILITDDLKVAEEWAERIAKKQAKEVKAKDKLDEEERKAVEKEEEERAKKEPESGKGGEEIEEVGGDDGDDHDEL